MNGQHLRAFIWLRWRLFVSQVRRGGIANRVVLAILSVGVVLLIFFSLVASFVVGWAAPSRAGPAVHMYVWDALIVAFLFVWSAGLLAELQRSEALSPEKFLHLPVSLTGVFVLNYLSSLVCLNLAVFLPVMVGLSVGLACARGPAQLLLLPLVAGFVLMVTALSYQFQGWLASLIVDKRRRRTVIVIATMVFLVISQLPNLLNMLRPWDGPTDRTAEESREMMAELESTAAIVNLCVPPGWLPYGAMSLAEGSVLPALLGAAGMALIGVGSLWRAYRTTVRFYTGSYTAGHKQSAPLAVEPARGVAKGQAGLLEKRLPWLSEQAAVIALGSFRTLLRAPEGKMMLLSPVFLLVIFGGMLIRGRGAMLKMFSENSASVTVPPLMAFSAMAMTLITLTPIVGNQFGLDRNGFRVFVLCPASRRDVILGKNLALAPLALALIIPAIVFLQVLYPLGVFFLLALVPQFASMYMLLCLLGNWVSILAPVHLASNSVKPSNLKMIPALLHMLFFVTLPLALAPTLLPLGIGGALEALDLAPGGAVCFGLSLVECAAIALLYRLLLTGQGSLLQASEQRILETVTTKAE